MDVKHRRQRHVDVVAVDPSLARSTAIFSRDAERMQHQLPVAEVIPFGRPVVPVV